MDMNDISANWHQLKGAVREKFGQLTDDDMLEIDGKVEVLVGKLQERYDISAEEAEERVNGLHSNQDGTKPSTDTTNAGDSQIQGEGNYDASRRYQKAQHEFADENTDSDNRLKQDQ